jgi:hypothetical protein
MTQNILQEFESATTAFLELLDSFDQQQINTVPYEGSWTAAQVGEHVFKSDNFILQSLNGPVKPTERKPDEQVAGLREMFLDFNTKLPTPDVIIPASGTHDKEALLPALKATREQIAHVIKTTDLTATCFNPILGEPTRLELINFINVHTQRHTHQLQKIAGKVMHKQPS